MRILIFHGYLLGGTGSNVYNARLAAALVELGHEVHLLSQDRHPEHLQFVDSVGGWDARGLHVSEVRKRTPGSGSCTVYRPQIGALLPVYVADRYEGIEARTFAECSEAEVGAYVEANVAAVRDVVAHASPAIALANHLVMGPVIVARALAGSAVPYAVKIHGSALEYTVKRDPERFLTYAREGLAGASGVLVGSHHTAQSLWGALEDPSLPKRTRLGPPGVDVKLFAPRDRELARERLRALSARLAEAHALARASASSRLPAAAGADAERPQAGEGDASDAFARDELQAARALQRVQPADDRLVAFVGKLIVSKGVDLLLAAWPLVLEQAPSARLLVVGFGGYRQGLEDLVASLARGDLSGAREIALAGRSLEAQVTAGASSGESGAQAAPVQPLRHLLAFLDSLEGSERARYLHGAQRLQARVIFTGRLEHEELADLLPACEALVVPSTFPEAFGMVAAEAAACGTLPISAAHSGLAEVAEALAAAVPAPIAELLSFPVDDLAVPALAERICGWLATGEQLRTEAVQGLVGTVRERWSWEGVARGVIAAAQGELEGLAAP